MSSREPTFYSSFQELTASRLIPPHEPLVRLFHPPQHGTAALPAGKL